MGWPQWGSILLGVLASLVYLACVPLSNGDVRDHLLHWTAYIVAHGRFDALGHAFSEYAPPYLYLLSLGTLLAPALGQLAVIKLVSIAGTMFLALCVRWLLLACVDAPTASRACVLTLCLPTVVANGPAWGQCDALYAGCAVLAVGAVARGRILCAMLATGVAVSFKLQGVFIAPLLLATLLAARGRWWTLALLPTTYAAMMLPAWIAGRPARDLALLYLYQGAYFHDLARSVPNMWQVLRALAPELPYVPGVLVGLLLAAAAVVLVALASRRRLDDPERVLLVALTGAMLVPYLLPKMHNRYFFLADVLAFAYAMVAGSPRAMRIAVLAQIASFLSYATFLLHLTGGAFVGALVMTAALVLVLREFSAKVAPFGSRMPYVPMRQRRFDAAGATSHPQKRAT
ncbi:hypothetical protein [Sphingomonas sp. BK580]|uniref:hypothetical protein n=1 Tax=Sphingomonas sp. BK580 TaxID=2586972 RepID=UPI00161357AA|nr:hypothetical protein [Sphingomonas sp. BK580]MBB3693599.1 Gpi18-like mannosyltransferase [Sphingomonas sp. BK580]